MFGEAKTQTITVVKPSAAEITSLILSNNIKSGEAFTGTVLVKNTGNVAWTDGENIRLGITGSIIARGYLPDGVTVVPGDSFMFAFSGTAPSSGDLFLTVQMLQECVTWFGEAESITVKNKDAQIVSTTIPSVLLPGQMQIIQVDVKNTGTATWTEKDSIRLFVGINGADFTRAFLPADVTVAPGGSYTFTFSVTAPASGNLVLAIQMIQECVTMFGEAKTQSITV